MKSSKSPETTVANPLDGRHGPRSKKGCSTCRIRKVKCDERRPLCARCTQSRVRCEWGQPPRPRRRTSSLSTGRGSIVPGRLLPLAQGCNAQDEVESPVEDPGRSASQSDQLSLVLTRRASILQPTLSTSHVSFSNSAELTLPELECFQYIPSSYLVLGLGKPWKRSIISYLHSSIAKQEPGVMRAFTAVAAMELRSRELAPSTQTDVRSLSSLDRVQHLQSVAMSNYRHALQELSSILHRATRPDRSEEDFNALFGLWFLMINFEQYGSELVDNSHIHLNGIRSFLSRALRSDELLKLPPASQMMLYFICHLDVNIALGNRRGGQLFQDLVSAPLGSGLHRDQLFEESRVCLAKIWGPDYSEQELMDDFENYRGLSLLSISTNLKLSVWREGVAIRKGNEGADPGSVARLWAKIESAEREFYDVLSVARMVKASSGKRVVYTVYHAALEYYGVRILFACLPTTNISPPPGRLQGRRPPWLDATLSSLVNIAYKSLAENPQLVCRYAWPIAMALLKTTDPVHRGWLRVQVQRAGVLLKNIGMTDGLIEDLIRQEPQDQERETEKMALERLFVESR